LLEFSPTTSSIPSRIFVVGVLSNNQQETLVSCRRELQQQQAFVVVGVLSNNLQEIFPAAK